MEEDGGNDGLVQDSFAFRAFSLGVVQVEDLGGKLVKVGEVDVVCRDEVVDDAHEAVNVVNSLVAVRLHAPSGGVAMRALM